MKATSLITCVVSCCALFGSLSFNAAQACTGMRMTSNDNAVVYGRTLEFGISFPTNVIAVDKGREYKGTTKLNTQNGINWTVKYPFVGAAPYEYAQIIDGVNSQGLSVGLFLFPGYAKYPELSKSNQSHALAPWELGTYLLSLCATVDDVKKILPNVTVVPVVMPEMGMMLPLHYAVNDASGKSIVIEYVDGGLNVYDNPIGVITNSPTFDWHLTNLNNYINLTANNVPPARFGQLEFEGFGQGTGLLGLRGDFTPPSRFVRAVFFSQSSLPMATGEDTVFQMFHLLNQFDIPKGSVRGNGSDKNQIDYTLWTSVSNLKDRKFYYRTYYNPEVKMVDLNEVNFSDKNIIRIKMTTESDKPAVTNVIQQ